MQDLVGSSINDLSSGRIPAYLVPLDLVEQVLRSATTTVLQSSQIHLAYSLSVDPRNLEIGCMLNAPS